MTAENIETQVVLDDLLSRGVAVVFVDDISKAAAAAEYLGHI